MTLVQREPFILPKIIATAGPACRDHDMLQNMIREGVRVFRVNFSHGSFDEFEKTVDIIRKASQAVGIEVAVFGDLSGPKLRIEKVIDGGVTVKAGDIIQFQATPVVAGVGDGPLAFSITEPSVLGDIEVGERLLINDGAVRALVTEKGEGNLSAAITVGGIITSKKGVNLPDSSLSVPSITEYDWKCVDWALAHDIDFLALSFVRSAADVIELKDYVRAHVNPQRGRLPITAKIEKPQAVADLDAIMDASER